MKTILKSIFLSAAGFALAVPAPVFAAETLKSTKAALQSERPVSDWAVTVGGLGLVKPEYEGSNDYEVTGFPIIDIKWRDRVFLNGRDGIGVNLWNDRMFTLSTSVGYSFGRNDGDSNDLAGLGDINGGAAAIIKGQLRYKGLSFTTRFSHQISGDDTGFLVDFGLGYFWRPEGRWFFRPGLSTSFASGKYMDKYFGITPGQAASSGLVAYDPDAGFKTVGANLLVGYALSRHWSVTGRFSYNRLLDDAAQSPVTIDKDQFTAGVGLSWRM